VAFAVVTVLYLAGFVFSVLNHSEDFLVVAFFSFPLIGLPISSRQSRNPVGWILLGIGLSWGLYSVLSGYASYALVTEPGSLPRPDIALALNSWTWLPAVGLMAIFLILLFPNGHLPSARWRPLAWTAGVTIVVSSLASVIAPGPFENQGFPDVSNPWGIEALQAPLNAFLVVGILILLVCIVASAVSAVKRLRRAGGIERLQLKWLAAAAAAAALCYLIVMGSAAVEHLTGQDDPLWGRIIEQVGLSSFALIPISVGIAILRYRLYDIDVIINRALVYALLSALLASIYVLGVVGAGALVRQVSGQASNNLAVAVSTLAVAGLFRPVRGRIQSFIDRRFYRRKYDARKTLEAFTGRLRDEVDLETLAEELLGAVREAMQPRSASIWLKGGLPVRGEATPPRAGS
jgi:hypothetical protein